MAGLPGKTVALGSPQSSTHQVSQPELADWMTEIEGLTGLSGFAFVRGSAAALAGLGSSGQYALVVTTAAERGIYERGASVWTKVASLPLILTESLAADQAEADRILAQAAAVSAEDDADAAAASAASAASSQSLADVARTQAQLAAVAAGATLYASVAAGEAGTVNGDVFLVSTEPGVQVYENDTGTGSFLGWLGEVMLDDGAAVDTWDPPATPATGLVVRTREEGEAYKVVTTGQTYTNASGVKLKLLTTARREITIPAEFSWFTKSIWVEPDGSAATDLDFQDYRVTPVATYFVRHTGGDDSNDGLTFATAFATMTKAMTMSVGSDIKIIMQPGTFFQSRGCWGSYTAARNVEIQPLGNGITTLLGCDSGVTWAKTSGRNYVYEATISATVAELAQSAFEAVADRAFLTSDGEYSGYSKAASVADCDANPGSWFWAAGTIYVHRLDQSAPDDNVCVWRQVSCIIAGATSGSQYRLVTQNINFHGVANNVVRGPTEGVRPLWVAKNCQFAYSQSVNATTGGGGFRAEGGDSIHLGCSYFRNAYDGANYHKHTSTINKCNAVEVSCSGYRNGLTGAGNNQGSTTHDGNSIIRLNCQYSDNEGQNIADVQAGTTSLNWNVSCTNSRKSTTPRNYDFDGGSGTVKAWLGNCKSGGRADWDITTTNVAEINIFGTTEWRYAGPAGAIRPWRFYS